MHPGESEIPSVRPHPLCPGCRSFLCIYCQVICFVHERKELTTLPSKESHSYCLWCLCLGLGTLADLFSVRMTPCPKLLCLPEVGVLPPFSMPDLSPLMLLFALTPMAAQGYLEESSIRQLEGQGHAATKCPPSPPQRGGPASQPALVLRQNAGDHSMP